MNISERNLAVGLQDAIKEFLRAPSKRELGLLFLLTLFGLMGNALNVEMGFGVNFIFGSIATMIAVRLSGMFWGALAGIVIGSYTYFLWGHSYAIIIFGLEALFVGFIVCHVKKEQMILADILYWLFIGIPLVWLFYSAVLGLSDAAVKLVALKQAVNGITNAIIASLIIQFTPASKLMVYGRSSKPLTHWSMNSAVNTLVAAFIILPLIVMMFLSTSGELKLAENDVKKMSQAQTNTVAREVSSILEWYSEKLAALVDMEFIGQESEERWRSLVERWKNNLSPSLINLSVLNSTGDVIFSYLDDESLVVKSKDLLNGYSAGALNVSSIALHSITLQRYFDVVVKLKDGRYLIASVDTSILTRQFDKISSEFSHVEVLDKNSKLVYSSNENRFDNYVRDDEAGYLYPQPTSLPTITVLQNSYWDERRAFNHLGGWSVRIVIPMKEVIEQLQVGYGEKLTTMLLLAIAALLLVPFGAAYITAPLSALSRAASRYSENPYRSNAVWPESNITEIDQLVGHSRNFLLAFNKKHADLVDSEIMFRTFFDHANAPISGMMLAVELTSGTSVLS